MKNTHNLYNNKKYHFITSCLILGLFNLQLQSCTSLSSLISSEKNLKNTKEKTTLKVIYEKIPDEFSDAKPLIDEFLEEVRAGKVRQKLIRFVDVNTDLDSFKSVSEGMKGHRTGPLFIQKVGDFHKLDEHAFKFKVTFLSVFSKETKILGYVAIKQNNGTWGFAPQ